MGERPERPVADQHVPGPHLRVGLGDPGHLVGPERAGDVLVGDRAFGSFAHLALLARQGLHGLFRLTAQRVIDFTPNRVGPARWDRKGLRGKARPR